MIWGVLKFQRNPTKSSKGTLQKVPKEPYKKFQRNPTKSSKGTLQKVLKEPYKKF
jgi:hypothetical protein